MDIFVASRTPAIELTLDMLQGIAAAENGRMLQHRFISIPKAGAVTLTDRLTAVSARVLDGMPGSGVLVLSARPHCAARSIMRGLFAERLLDGHRFAAFGTRRTTDDEAGFLAGHHAQVFTMLEISREGLQETTDAVMAYVRGWRSFYLVIDLDVADAVFTPGIAEPSVGGFTSRELLYVLQRLLLIPSLSGVELVYEAARPEAPAAQLAAHILAEAAARATPGAVIDGTARIRNQ